MWQFRQGDVVLAQQAGGKYAAGYVVSRAVRRTDFAYVVSVNGSRGVYPAKSVINGWGAMYLEEFDPGLWLLTTTGRDVLRVDHPEILGVDHLGKVLSGDRKHQVQRVQFSLRQFAKDVLTAVHQL